MDGLNVPSCPLPVPCLLMTGASDQLVPVVSCMAMSRLTLHLACVPCSMDPILLPQIDPSVKLYNHGEGPY